MAPGRCCIFKPGGCCAPFCEIFILIAFCKTRTTLFLSSFSLLRLILHNLTLFQCFPSLNQSSDISPLLCFSCSVSLHGQCFPAALQGKFDFYSDNDVRLFSKKLLCFIIFKNHRLKVNLNFIIPFCCTRTHFLPLPCCCPFQTSLWGFFFPCSQVVKVLWELRKDLPDSLIKKPLALTFVVIHTLPSLPSFFLQECVTVCVGTPMDRQCLFRTLPNSLNFCKFFANICFLTWSLVGSSSMDVESF